jgi:hypothetical protein
MVLGVCVMCVMERGGSIGGDGNMKKLVLLLSALLVLSAFAASPASAARPSLDIRVQSILAALYQSMFPLSGVFVMPGDIVPVNRGGGGGGFVGGDADDYGNGRGADAGSDLRGGPPKIVRDVLPPTEPDGVNKGITVPKQTR